MNKYTDICIYIQYVRLYRAGQQAGKLHKTDRQNTCFCATTNHKKTKNFCEKSVDKSICIVNISRQEKGHTNLTIKERENKNL